MQQHIGYHNLSNALDGWRTAPELRALDKRNRLGLSRHWHEGQRAFDAAEVAQLRARIAANDPTLPKERQR